MKAKGSFRGPFAGHADQTKPKNSPQVHGSMKVPTIPEGGPKGAGPNRILSRPIGGHSTASKQAPFSHRTK